MKCRSARVAGFELSIVIGVGGASTAERCVFSLTSGRQAGATVGVASRGDHERCVREAAAARARLPPDPKIATVQDGLAVTGLASRVRKLGSELNDGIMLRGIQSSIYLM
jgi:hypothetical protein